VPSSTHCRAFEYRFLLPSSCLQGGKQRRVRHLRANGGPGAVDGGKKRAPGRDDCAVYQTDVADSEVSAAAWESVENECY